jgi:3'-phosphoadenosine 5'-phosphosulfate sulfotransferase (PAPS reductase)/FAD synthetase
MNLVLGVKQRSTHEDWLEVYRHIDRYVSRAEIELRVSKAISEIRAVVAGRNAAFAWSGGKDSVAVQFLCEQAGIHECLMGMSNLEYPEFLRWVTDNMPSRLEVYNTGQDLEWLAANLHMLFPPTARIAATWFKIIQHTAQKNYFLNRDVDVLILGRRKQDGNYVGRPGFNWYEDRNGVVRYSPTADWKHEEILALINYYNLPMAPFYSWPKGYRCGTHSWPARQYTGSIENGWAEVYEIDSSRVVEASRYIASASEFLMRMK